jgi:Flp pilus assembly protein TadD
MRVWDQKGNVFEGLYGDLMRITSQQLAENQITGDYSQWATGRPIYYTWKDQQRINEINRRYYTPQGQAPRGFVTTGILYRIQPENIPYQHRFDYWGNYKFLWEKYPEQAVHWDYLAREIVANYNFQMGDRYLLQADELKNAYNAGMTSWQGIPRTEFLKQIDVLEDRGFSYYDRAAYFGFDMVAIHFNFGIFLEQKAIDQLRRGRKDKAVEYLKRAIERYKSAVDVDNEEIRAYMNLAAAYERLSSLQENEEAKWLEEAKKVLDRAKKMAPTYPQLDGYLQRISNRLKYPAAKLAELQNRVNTNPKDRPAVDELLKALLDRGDLQLGMQLLESVLKNYPNDWNYLNTLASLSGQLGDIGRTIRYLGMLGAIQPQNSAIWFNIGELYARQQDNRRATEYYRRTVVSGQNNPQFQKEVAAARQKLQSLGAAP